MLEDGTLLSGGGAEIKAWDSINYFRRVKERTVGYMNTFIRTKQTEDNNKIQRKLH